MLRGRILQAWREYGELSASELATRMHVGTSTISMWEHGARGRRVAAGLGTVRSIADNLKLSADHAAALADLWASAGSVRALPPRIFWANNFQPPNGPVWVWLRPATQDVTTAQLWWLIPAANQVRLECSRTGVLLQFPASVPHPALEVTFTRPGWADFGRGVVPPEIAKQLRIRLIPALELSPLRDEQRAIDWVRERAPGLLAARPQSGRASSRAGSTKLTVPPLSPGLAADARGLVTQLRMTPGQAQRLREGRGFSRQAAAAEATALTPGAPLTAKMIETIEGGGRLPTAASLLSRLDLVYGADGHLGIDRTFTSGSRAGAGAVIEIDFPDFWWGPVWLQFSGPEFSERLSAATGIAELAWGRLRGEHLVRHGAVLTTRKARTAMEPLRVRVPSGWGVAAGTGHVPTAHDIGRDWHAVNLETARLVLLNMAAYIQRQHLGLMCPDAEPP